MVFYVKGGTWVDEFENRIPRRISGRKRNENEAPRKIHNEKLQSLYRSSNVGRLIKSKLLKWSGHVARWENHKSVLAF